jgi:hypothetical protein
MLFQIRLQEDQGKRITKTISEQNRESTCILRIRAKDIFRERRILASGIRPDNDTDMQTTTINSWNDFVARVEAFHAERDAHASHAVGAVSELLYRGQPDSRFGLKTTLERAVSREIGLSNYHRFVSVIRAKIESVIGKAWPIPTQEDFEKWLIGQHGLFRDLPGYAFLAYLRHHGLPSPLLDWTRSPYVAAHFALAYPPSGDVESAAIFVYLESPTGTKSGDETAPTITTLGPYVATHRRHYLQQSEYTICTAGSDQSLCYASHEAVVARDDKGQDLLWKLVIPVSHRRVFVEHLQRMNISPFSLFETEDALMQDINLSEIFLRKRL